MKKILLLSAVVSLGVCSFALSSSAQAPAGAPAGSTGMCNDGTYSTAATKSGACRGHKGIKQWFSADATPAKTAKTAPATSTPAAATPATKTAVPVAAPAPAPAPKAAPAAPPAVAASAKTAKPKGTPAPGGGPGLVWLNTSTKVYHCNGDADYGTTKAGKYLSEADAKAAGGRASHGKGCS